MKVHTTLSLLSGPWCLPQEQGAHMSGQPLSSAAATGARIMNCVVRVRRLSLEDAQALALRRGGKCWSKKYTNNKKLLDWSCSKGHRWSASLNSVKDSGTWCPWCANEARRLTLQVAQDVASERGGKCLSTRYINHRNHLKWSCSKGHTWSASLHSVKNRRSWCPHCAIETRRLSLTVAKDVAAGRGGLCLSSGYANNKKPLKWKCSTGHTWSASLYAVKDMGSWCPHCVVQAQRLSLKIAQDAAKKRNGKCLSTKYVSNRRHLKWMCSEGHSWSASLNSVKDKSSWCPHCVADARRLTLEVAQDLALKRNGACLSEKYVSNRKHLQWSCSHGHQWTASLNSVKDKGSWCPHCAIEAQRLSSRVAQDVARARFGKCLSTNYTNSRKRLKWRCSRGHKWSASLSNVKCKNTWCPHCVGNARLSLKVARKVARARGGACLSTKYVNNHRHLIWRCMEGHLWSASLNAVKDKHSWCPECSSGISEKGVRTILEKSIFPGNCFRKCRPKFLSTLRGGRLELDGFNEELGIALDLEHRKHVHVFLISCRPDHKRWLLIEKYQSFSNLNYLSFVHPK